MEHSERSKSKKDKKKKEKSKKRQREDDQIDLDLKDTHNEIVESHLQENIIHYPTHHSDLQYLNTFSNNDGHSTQTSSGYKSGKYTKEEDEILWDAIREYISEKGWNQEEGLNMLLSPLKTKDKRLRNAWTQIASSLPDRKRTSVFDHARRRFSTVNYQGRWTKEEEARLRDLYQAHGSDWVEIGLKLNKLPQSCRDKWRQIKNENRNTGTWSEEETSNLYEIIKSMHGGQLPEMGTKIKWSEVSNKMESRSWYQCQVKWNLLNGNKKKFKSGS